MKTDNQTKIKHLTKHGTLLEDSDFDKQCNRLLLVLIKSDKHQTKMSREPPLSGPHIVIHINVKSRIY